MDFSGSAKVALGGAEHGSQRKNCSWQDQKLAAGCILRGSWDPKLEIPVKNSSNRGLRRMLDASKLEAV
jgi:hypothetical protein